MLELVQAVSDPGRADKPNEDGYGVAGGFAWVIDGATGLADTPLLDAPSDAAWLTATMSACLSEGAERHNDPAALMKEAAAVCARRFADERLRAPAERYEMPTAAIILAHFGPTVTFADLGDCGAFVRSINGTVNRYCGSVRSKELEAQNARALMSGGGGRTPEVLAFLRRVRNQANMPGGYAIFAPEENGADGVRLSAHDEPHGTFLFMTDGFEAASDDYGLFDRASLFAEAEGAGLRAIVERVRAIEASDPDCRRFPRFKPSDDATAILLRKRA